MQRQKLGYFSLLAATTAAVSMTAGWAHANPVVVSTFDTPSSFVNEPGPPDPQLGFPTFGTYGIDNPTAGPKVPNVRYDYVGQATPANTFAAAWSSDDAGGDPNSGSLAISWTWNTTTDGAGAVPFTLDINNNVTNYTNIAFDIKVVAGSAVDTFGGEGDFQVVSRNANYDFTGTGFDEELGNPTFGTPDVGSWVHVSIPLATPARKPIRGITFQLYGDAARNLNGPATIELDNLVLTDTNVPEPASFGALLLSGTALLARRRRGC